LDDIDALAALRDLRSTETVDRSKILREFVSTGLESHEAEVAEAHDTLDGVADEG
jgi:hypothetical protein